jgi:hypothetical protein
MKKNKFAYMIVFILMTTSAILTIIDIIIGMSIPIGKIPISSLEYLELFKSNPFLGLYLLDFLNLLNTIIICAYIVILLIFILNNHKNLRYLALLLVIIGTILFIINNGSIHMYNLSSLYYSTNDSTVMANTLTKAQELLDSSAHGSLKNFLGSFLLSSSNLLIVYMICKKIKVRNAITKIGYIGYGLILIYVVLITFIFDLNSFMMLLAAFGGILVLVWQLYTSIKFLKLYCLRQS